MKKALFLLATVLFCIGQSQNALAKATNPANTGLGLNRLGVEAGLVDPEAAGSTLGFGAFADLGTLAPDIRLSSHLGYWSKSENDFDAEASVRDVSIGARARYMFHVTSPKVQPYAGAGLGLHFFHTKVAVPDMDLGGGFIVPGFTVEDSATKPGLDLGGGAITPLSPRTDLFVDLWYTLADVDQLSMKVGVSFQLSR
jgi:opacity protein-like surface antigen